MDCAFSNNCIAMWLTAVFVRIMSPVLCVLSVKLQCLLQLMKHRVTWSLLLYRRHMALLGQLH